MKELESVEQAIAALELQRPTIGDAVVDLAMTPLVERRNRLLAGTAGEQRKLVTVLFADLVDFTVLSRSLDPEDVRAIVAQYFTVWSRCIEAEGGVVEKFIGDAVMAVFGIHRAREDDPHRAVRAALAMTERLASLNPGLQARQGLSLRMRVGIDTGEVVVSTLGDQPGSDFVAVGENVNRAARLQAAAPPGGILISSDTCVHVKGSFALQRVESLQLKGIAEPVEAYLALAGGPSAFWPETRGLEGVSTRTIGRHLELGWLQKAFDDVAGTGPDGDGTTGGLVIASVVGHAGVGKSRVLRDFETWLAGRPDHIRLLRGRASPTTESVPNGLLRSVFTERLGIVAGDAPDVVLAKWQGLAGELGDAEEGADTVHLLARWLGFEVTDSPYLDGLSADPQGLRNRALAALGDYFVRLSEATPVVLLIEDAHWADDATLDWLIGLDGWLRDRPVLVVVTARPSLLERRPHWGEGLDAHAVLRLGPLSRRDSVRLVGELMQRADEVPDAITDLVASTSEGNPFFVEELVKWLVGEGVVDTSQERWSVSGEALDLTRVPATLKGVIQARLDALAPDERATAQRAAVVGRVFWDSAVHHLDPGTDADDALARLRAREVVFRREQSAFAGATEFSFRHALLRDVAYESLLRATRRTYHGRVAEWLEALAAETGRGDEYAAVIAQHHAEAGQEAEAAHWYLRAGRGAAGIFANTEALTLLRRAEQLAPSGNPGLGIDIMLAIEGVLDRVGDREAQRAVLDALGEADDRTDPLRTSTILLAEARWLYFHGRYDASAAVSADAVVLARAAGSTRLEAESLNRLGSALAWSGEHDEAQAALVRAQDLAAAASELSLVGTSLRIQAVVAVNRGDYPAALDLVEQARAIHRDNHELYQESMDVSQTAYVLEMMGRLDAAQDVYGVALAMAERLGQRFTQALIIGNIAGLAITRGRLGEGRRRASQALAMCVDIGDVEGQAEMQLLVGEVARLTGDHGAAHERFAMAVDMALPIHADAIAVRALALRALIALGERTVDEAQRLSVQALETATRSGIPATVGRARLVEGLVLLASGDPAAALEPLERARAVGAEMDVAPAVLESEVAVAAALMACGRSGEALARAGALVGRLEPSDLAGCLDQGRVLLTCHDVLAQAGAASATRVRQANERYFDHWWSAIDDEDLRSGFTELNPVNVALARYTAMAPAPLAGPGTYPEYEPLVNDRDQRRIGLEGGQGS